MKQGLSIHCHHNILLEPCYDYDERVRAIKTNKPQNEQEIRLRLFKLLPQKAIDELPDRLVKANQEWAKAYQEWEKAYQEWEKVDREREKADQEWEKADQEQGKAYQEWKKAYQEWQKAYQEWEKVDREREKADQEWQKASQEWQKADKDAWHKKWCGCKYWQDGRIDFSIS